MPHSSSSVSRHFRSGWPRGSTKPCGPLQAPVSKEKLTRKGMIKKENQNEITIMFPLACPE